jgi:hypothetical protein
MTMRAIPGLVLFSLLWTLTPALASAAEPPVEKLLLGFEEEDFTRISKAIPITRKEGKTKEGQAFIGWEGAGGFAQLGQWMVFKGKASQGQYALGIGLVRHQQALTYSPAPFALPPEPVFYYGLLNDPYASNGSLFNTCGVFRRIFPVDWSEYDLLRLDAHGEEVKQTIRIMLEDEEISPPIVRNFTVEPGKWMTLEIDLRTAVKERGLNLKRMATLAIGVAELSEKPKTARQHTALIDNLRLARRDVPARLPVVHDPASHALPEYYRTSKSSPEKLPDGNPDRTPLRLEKPFLVLGEKVCNVAPVGWVAAYDNKHLLVGFDGGAIRNLAGPVFLLQTLDGGQSWRGLDGGEKPTHLHIFNNDHGSGRGDVVGARADVLLFNNLGCEGPNIASLRLFSSKLTFTGKGWELRKPPTLVDCDLRHCNSNQTVVRTADGRLWAAYGLVGRLGTNCINVRYSDDNGVSWKGWSENRTVLPGSIHPDAKGVGFGYTFEEPCLVPFGKGIACIWQERQGYDFVKLLWTHFDGKEWLPIQEIKQPKRTVSGPVSRPPIHAVSMAGKEIFLVSALWPGVLHFQGDQWKAEPVDVPPGSRISVAGDRTVVVIAGVSSAINKGPVVLQSWQRSRTGRWSGPIELAREEKPLSHSHDGIYVIRPGLVVQPYAPPNFVPVAWTCERQKGVKVLRVPVSD